jgi:hypothetical protein
MVSSGDMPCESRQKSHAKSAPCAEINSPIAMQITITDFFMDYLPSLIHEEYIEIDGFVIVITDISEVKEQKKNGDIPPR